MIALGFVTYLVRVFSSLDINYAVREALAQHPSQIESLLKTQLYAGVSSTGAKIAPRYTNYTQMRKAEVGQPYDRVTLYSEGNLYRSIFMETMPKAFDFNVFDWKAQSLKDKYEPRSGKLFSLTKEHIKEVAQIIKPDLEQILIAQIRKLR